MSILYSAVIHNHYKICDLNDIGIFTTEKKAIDIIA